MGIVQNFANFFDTVVNFFRNIWNFIISIDDPIVTILARMLEYRDIFIVRLPSVLFLPLTLSMVTIFFLSILKFILGRMSH